MIKFKFKLVSLDGYTRWLWTVALKNKNAATVKEAFEKVYRESGRYPCKIWADNRKEF